VEVEERRAFLTPANAPGSHSFAPPRDYTRGLNVLTNTGAYRFELGESYEIAAVSTLAGIDTL
jgi:hypothetical protein